MNVFWRTPFQDDYLEALEKLHMTVSRAYKVNPSIKFEVFIHKVDGLSDDHKIETQRDIHQRANDDLSEAGLENLHLRYTNINIIQACGLMLNIICRVSSLNEWVLLTCIWGGGAKGIVTSYWNRGYVCHFVIQCGKGEIRVYFASKSVAILSGQPLIYISFISVSIWRVYMTIQYLKPSVRWFKNLYLSCQH